MEVERNRLDTFALWPSDSSLSPDRLARAGFYYIGDGTDDKVECFSCHGRHEGWRSGDVVMAVHATLFPDCPFVRDPLTDDNVPYVNRPRGRSPARPSTDSARPSVDDSFGSETTSYPDGSVTHLLPHNHVLGAAYMTRSERLATFQHWTHERPSSSSMADAGFVSTNADDQVFCQHCHGRLHEWSPEDDPLLEHARHFPHCTFIQSVSDRSPLRQSARESTSARSSAVYADPDTSDESDNTRSRDVSGSGRLPGEDYAGNEFGEPPLGGLPDPGTPVRMRASRAAVQQDELEDEDALRKQHTPKLLQHQTSVERHLASVGVCTNRPVNACMANYHKRVESFTAAWPHSSARLTPDEMAAAGFFSLNDADKVKCFHCDGGLRNWTVEDDPFVEHAKWFSQCSFLRLVKGEQFIRRCRDAPHASTQSIACPPATPAPAAKHPCVVCMDAESSVVLLPCGHLCACVNCAPPLTKCPICRNDTKGLIRAFLP